MSAFYAVVMGDEDGRSFRPIHDVDGLLRDPKGEMGITTWQEHQFLVEHPDPNYWPKGTAVLLKYEVVRPVPAGAFVLPSSDGFLT